MPELQLVSNDSTDVQGRAATLRSSLRARFDSGVTKPLSWRLSQLDALEHMLFERERDILDALRSDLRKPELEAFASEIGVIRSEIKLVRKRLRSWMKPKRVRTSLIALPGRSYVVPEPLGLVLIIAPWNYPFQTADPAAGRRARRGQLRRHQAVRGRARRPRLFSRSGFRGISMPAR